MFGLSAEEVARVAGQVDKTAADITNIKAKQLEQDGKLDEILARLPPKAESA